MNKIKLIIALSFIILVSLPALAQANDIYRKTCERFRYKSDFNTCFDHLAGVYVNHEAAKVCKTFRYRDSAMECVEAIADNYISDSDARYCGRYRYTDSIVDCFYKRGKTVRYSAD